MFRLSACVAIINDRLRRHFQNFIQRIHPCRRIDSLDIRLPLRRGIGERARPHSVEFFDTRRRFEPYLLDDEAAERVVQVKETQQRLSIQHSTQARATYVRRCADFLHRSMQFGRGYAGRIRHFDKLAAPFGQGGYYGLPHPCLHASPPIVSMDHDVGFVAPQIRFIIERILRHHPRDTLQF